MTIELDLVRWTDVRALGMMGDGIQTIPEMASYLGISRAAMSVTMDRCVRLGLVSWRPAHGRLRIYTMTRRGEAMLAASRDMRAALALEP